MSEFFSSGHIADIMLAFMFIEGIVLIAFNLKTGRGPAPPEVIWLLLPGACLVLALRISLVGATSASAPSSGHPWVWLALAVSASLIAHLGDLRQRFLRNKSLS